MTAPAAPRRLVIEADGASRGNPGAASYGALVRDADTRAVLVERGERIGTATNNVAEYSGLIAGLEAAFEIDAAAEVEVRMDSKLVIEQMAGRWKIKHANLRPLALAARALIPVGAAVTWTWIPRERNSHADALANAALDGEPAGGPSAAPEREVVTAQPGAPEVAIRTGAAPKIIGWAEDLGAVSTLHLLRHGETPHTVEKRFSGTRFDPALSARGEGQVELAARHLQARGGIEVVVSSPMRRARQTAQAVAGPLGLEVSVDEDLRECDFGEWDGLTFAEVRDGWPDELAAWLADPALAPPGGESLVDLELRVGAALKRILAEHAGRTVLLAGHVGSIKMLVRFALDGPMHLMHRLQLAPASLSTVRWYGDGNSALHAFNDTAHLADLARLDGR